MPVSDSNLQGESVGSAHESSEEMNSRFTARSGLYALLQV